MNQPYPSDLTRSQFDEFLAPLIPEAKPGGRPRTVDMFAVINAILFVLYTGCQWRSLPHDYPNWSTVYYYFNQWRKNGTWQTIHDHLRMQVRVKKAAIPDPQPAFVMLNRSKQVILGFKPRGLMGARSSKVANAISWWIPWAYCWW